MHVTDDVTSSKSGSASRLSRPGGVVIGTALSSDTFTPAQLADALTAAVTTQSASAQRFNDCFGRSLNDVVDALGRVRQAGDPDQVIDLAPRELCAAGLFERVILSRVRGSAWRIADVYVARPDGQVALHVDGLVEQLDIALVSPLVEAEVVRRRLPALVHDARRESRVCRQLMERTGTTEYVVAPVVADASVIALIHADRPADGRALSAIDRDLLRMFADGVGLIYERAGIAERAARQAQTIAQACDAAVRSLGAVPATPALRFGATAVQPVPAATRELAEPPREHSRLSRLTSREREVLALLASGATNSQLADRLTVAESTVKSHVKHILHKLGAGNRAAAIACYLGESKAENRRSR